MRAHSLKHAWPLFPSPSRPARWPAEFQISIHPIGKVGEWSPVLCRKHVAYSALAHTTLHPHCTAPRRTFNPSHQSIPSPSFHPTSQPIALHSPAKILHPSHPSCPALLHLTSPSLLTSPYLALPSNIPTSPPHTSISSITIPGKAPRRSDPDRVNPFPFLPFPSCLLYRSNTRSPRARHDTRNSTLRNTGHRDAGCCLHVSCRAPDVQVPTTYLVAVGMAPRKRDWTQNRRISAR